MSRDKQNEIHELAKQMSEAISTEVERRYIEDEAKLQAVLIENGWRKSTDLAEEIFAEIEKKVKASLTAYLEEINKEHIQDTPLYDRCSGIVFARKSYKNCFYERRNRR